MLPTTAWAASTVIVSLSGIGTLSCKSTALPNYSNNISTAWELHILPRTIQAVEVVYIYTCTVYKYVEASTYTRLASQPLPRGRAGWQVYTYTCTVYKLLACFSKKEFLYLKTFIYPEWSQTENQLALHHISGNHISQHRSGHFHTIMHYSLICGSSLQLEGGVVANP